MRNYSVFFIVIAIFFSSYCFAASSVEEQYARGRHQHKEKDENLEKLELSGKLQDGIRVVEVKASRYKFVPDPIVVKLGEKVRLVVTSADVTHGLAISKFKINLSVSPGEAEGIEFVADKKGTFQIYCSVYCGPGHGHMHASLIVR